MYISSLSNSKSQHHPELVFQPSTKIPNRLYTWENHPGLINALFANLDDLPVFESVPHTWWRVIDITETNVSILGESDISSTLLYPLSETSSSIRALNSVA